MDSSLKNITVILVIITFAFAGYYMFMQKGKSELATGGDSVNQALFTDVQKYIARREILDNIRLDMSLFNDPRFHSLVSLSSAEVTQPVGRVNPFDEVRSRANPSADSF